MPQKISYRAFFPKWMLTCAALLLAGARLGANDWPQWFGPDRDGIWKESGLVDKFPSGGPKVLWRTPIASGYSGPAVASGRVYLMDRETRKGPDGKPARGAKGALLGKERVLCLDESDGKILWRHEYDCPYKVSYPSGPRTTPIVHEGHVYALGTMGDLRCLRADTGDLVWKKNLLKEYKAPTPVWGYSASLLLDGNLLYSLVGGEDSAVVAFDKNTGKEVWRALTASEVCYSPPMIYRLAGKRQLIIWHSESINGLDPATGKVYWSQAYPRKGEPQSPAVNVVTVRQAGDRLFLSSTYHGPMLIEVTGKEPAVKVCWSSRIKNPEKPESLNCLVPTPVLKDGYIYGCSFPGELCCLKLDDGKRVWQTYAALDGKKADCGTVFLVPYQPTGSTRRHLQGNRFVLFNDQGDLILAHLSPAGYQEIDRARILEPVQAVRGRQIVWSHPAFADRCVFARNDKELVCVSLAAVGPG
jgi:outer membrane protein assembly factor BamB